jgi:hypothetical protein
VNGGHHSDDDAVLDGNQEMVPRIGDEPGGPTAIDGTVEYVACHTVENRCVAGGDEKDFWLAGHDDLSRLRQ